MILSNFLHIITVMLVDLPKKIYTMLIAGLYLVRGICVKAVWIKHLREYKTITVLGFRRFRVVNKSGQISTIIPMVKIGKYLI